MAFITKTHPSEIEVFTDHKNLIYLFKAPSETKLCSVGRLYRWALILQNYRLSVLHIDGDLNVIADLLSRWGYGDGDDTAENLKLRPVSNFHMELRPDVLLVGNTKLVLRDTPYKYDNLLRKDGSTKPSETEAEKVRMVKQSEKEKTEHDVAIGRLSFLNADLIHLYHPLNLVDLWTEQTLAREKPPNGTKDEEGLIRVDGKLWIPETMLTKVLSYNHIRMGHSAPTTEREALRNFYFMMSEKELRSRLIRCKQICLNCDKFPAFIRRPLEPLKHASRPNEMLHSDFLSLGNGRYIITLVDDFSRKTLIMAAERPESDNFLRIMTMWKAINGTAVELIVCTDQGSHYCNQFVQAFKLLFPFVHKISVVYAPWSNGPAEAINKEILKYFKNMISQYRLEEDDWRELIPLVMYYINTRPNPKWRTQDGICLNALQVFGGRDAHSEPLFHPGDQPRNELLIPVVVGKKVVNPTDVHQVVKYLAGIAAEMDKIDEVVYQVNLESRKAQRNRLNQRLRIESIQYAAGDWVLVSKVTLPIRSEKLKFDWRGPYIVVNVLGRNVYEVEDPWRKNTCEVHAQRMRMYEPNGYEPSEEVKSMFIHNDHGIYNVQEIIGIRDVDNNIEVQVWWQGFERESASWHPYVTIKEDVPAMVQRFLLENKDTNTLAARMLIDDSWTANEKVLMIDDLQGHLSGSKGWTLKEDQQLEKLTLIHGYGNWTAMLASGYLPGKTKAQLVSRTKQLTGCQKLGEINGHRVTFDTVRLHAAERNLPDHPDQDTRERNTKYNNEVFEQYKAPIPTEHELEILGPEDISKGDLRTTEMESILGRINQRSSEIKDQMQPRWKKQRRASQALTIYARDGFKKWKRVNAILDSGATLSIISKSEVPEGIEVTPLKKSGLVECTDVQNKPMNILGSVILTFDIHCTWKGELPATEPVESIPGKMRLSNCELFVVNEGHHVIIGAEILGELELLPWQTLHERLTRHSSAHYDLKSVRMQEDELIGIDQKMETIDKLQQAKMEWETKLKQCKTAEAIKVQLREFWNERYGDIRLSFKKKFYNKSATFQKENLVIGVPMPIYDASDTENSKFKFEAHGDNWYTLIGYGDPLKCWIAPLNCQRRHRNLLEDKWYIGVPKADVLLIDFPWEISGDSPTCGVALGYKSWTQNQIEALDFTKIQTEGFVFMWATNAMVQFAIELLTKKGYKVVEYLVWVKKSNKHKLQSGTGYYLRHAKEVCIVARTEPMPDMTGYNRMIACDVMEAPVRVQSRKPDEIYDLIEAFAPGKRKVELFARAHNCRDGWTMVGDQLYHQDEVGPGLHPMLQEPRQV